MRVTPSTYANELRLQLTRLGQRQSRLQQQAATGQRVQVASDDPVAMRRIMDLQTESRKLGQYQENIARQQESASASYHAIRALQRLVERASEIAIAADDLRSPEELAIYAKEITELIKQAVHEANTRHHGDALFGGTRKDQPPFQLALDPDGRVTGVTYQGNTESPAVEVAAGVTLTTEHLGANPAGSGPRGLLADPRDGVDVFGHLIDLQNRLLAGDTAAIQQSSRAALVSDSDHLIVQIGTNGALQARLEALTSVAEQRSLAIDNRVSAEADVDLAETLVRLTQTQTAYQAALQSASRLLNQSLLDYIR